MNPSIVLMIFQKIGLRKLSMCDEIFFNQEFYELNAINQACKDYEHIAKIQVKIEDNGYICRIYKSNLNIDKVKYEFANYVLAMSVKQMRYMEE